MATHLGLLAQEFAWTEEPSRLQSAEQNTTQHTDRLESFCKNMLIGMSHLFPFLLSCYSDLVLIFI